MSEFEFNDLNFSYAGSQGISSEATQPQNPAGVNIFKSCMEMKKQDSQ